MAYEPVGCGNLCLVPEIRSRQRSCVLLRSRVLLLPQTHLLFCSPGYFARKFAYFVGVVRHRLSRPLGCWVLVRHCYLGVIDGVFMDAGCVIVWSLVLSFLFVTILFLVVVL